MKHLDAGILLGGSAVALTGGWLLWTNYASSITSTQSANLYEAASFSVELPQDPSPLNRALEGVEYPLVFETSDGTAGFQVFTRPVNGPLPKTADELKEGLPELVIKDFTNTRVVAVDAISFFSYDADIGHTFEVWFVHRGLLYQVMTYAALDVWLTDLLKTWRFR
jgi:hypothetical protein